MLKVLLNKISKDEIFVVELSSYQLDDMEFSPDIAVITNLFPEHMDYHKGVENYYVAKKNIINFQNSWNYFIYNRDDEKLRKWAKDSKAINIPFGGKKISEKMDTKLLGGHNQKNIEAALAVAHVLKISDKITKRAIKNFQPLSHRLELVGKFKGIKFYDDAISTTPQSTIAALEAIPNVKTIFLGGEDRGYDFLQLEKELGKYKIENIVLFPESGKRILKSKKNFRILETKSMKKAVEFAYKYTPKGSACLLSTASPSYSLWKNFEEKGDEFKKAIRKIE